MAINIGNLRLTSTARTASVDASYGPYLASTLEDALALAEMSLYYSKAPGRTVGIVISDGETTSSVMEYWYLYNDEDLLVLVEKSSVEAIPNKDIMDIVIPPEEPEEPEEEEEENNE